METPDITPVQKLGAASLGGLIALIALLKAFGVDLDEAQAAAIIGFATAFVSVAVAADAVIRHGRSKVAAVHAETELVKQAASLGSGD